MRKTIRVDDQLLEQLRAQARRENVSLTHLINRILSVGLQVGGARRRKQPIYREQVHSLGAPRIVLEKTLTLAAGLENEEITHRLRLRE